MKQIFRSSDFIQYFNKTNSIIAASIAQDLIEEFLKKLIKDPTMGATGEFAQGYRSAINDLMRELENK